MKIKRGGKHLEYFKENRIIKPFAPKGVRRLEGCSVEFRSLYLLRLAGGAFRVRLRYREAEGKPQAPVRFVYALEKGQKTLFALAKAQARLRPAGNDRGSVCGQQSGNGDAERGAPSLQKYSTHKARDTANCALIAWCLGGDPSVNHQDTKTPREAIRCGCLVPVSWWRPVCKPPRHEDTKSG